MKRTGNFITANLDGDRFEKCCWLELIRPLLNFLGKYRLVIKMDSVISDKLSLKRSVIFVYQFHQLPALLPLQLVKIPNRCK
jgi:hypothetical protein